MKIVNIIAEILFFTFITLKLFNVIHWSWWWVLSPLWIGVILALLVGVAEGYLEARKEQELVKDVIKQQVLNQIPEEMRGHIKNINVELRTKKKDEDKRDKVR